jgi:CDP-diacylglycerol--serine O-phosphatidyltransferase
MAALPRLPDILTTANLCCGVGSILLASQGQLTWACWLVFAGAFFDVLDGLAARALGGGSELGKQLDSLADMVTFGVAPAFVLWTLASSPVSFLGSWVAALADRFLDPEVGQRQLLLGASAMVLVVASCWRLARFNLDTRQASGFLGLPTPANGLFWSASVLAALGVGVRQGPGHATLDRILANLMGQPSLLLVACLAMAALMLSSIPLPSLKFKHMGWKGNEVIYLLLCMGAVLVILYGMLAVPLIMILYLLSPLWGRVFGKGV